MEPVKQIFTAVISATDEERHQIARALQDFPEIRYSFTDHTQISNEFDVYIIPSRELERVPGDLLMNGMYPFLVYGPMEMIRFSMIYAIADFISFPFAGEELPVRIKKQAPFRYRFSPGKEFSFNEETIRSKDLELHITYTDFLLLRLLTGAAPHPVPREVLGDCLPYKKSTDSRSLDMAISKLRKKVKYVLATENDLIVGERGNGYRLTRH